MQAPFRGPAPVDPGEAVYYALIMGSGSLTRRGDLLPDIALPLLDGRLIRLADYRGRSNLVIVLVGHGEDRNVLRLLDEMAAKHSEFAAEESAVLAIVSKDGALKAESRWPFMVLADDEGRAHRLFDAVDTHGRLSPAVFVADRYGEIYATYRSEEGHGLPSTEEILRWLFFINSQCPECGVPDWPR